MGFTQGNLQSIKMDEAERNCPASWGLVLDWAKNDLESFRNKSYALNTRGDRVFEKSSDKKREANRVLTKVVVFLCLKDFAR
jgi:hypothetical protein